MTFRVAQKTLERLEWPQVLARLAGRTRTPRARARLAVSDEAPAGHGVFEDSLEAVHEKLTETSEARDILGAGESAPLDGIVELGDALARARKGGVLAPRELLDLGASLAALRRTRGFLERHRDRAPRLASRAEMLVDHIALERAVETCLEPSGEVRDEASPALAQARAETQRQAALIQSRLDRLLRDTHVRASLSDVYFTVRNDRYVLPVRADARGDIRGIVHDASSSGSTLFVEPEALVEANNRHKQAELEIDREITRVLRDLSARAAAAAEHLEPELEILADVDLAFARAELAEEMHATAPEVGEEGIFVLPQLRHPELRLDQAVPNDLRLGEGFCVLVISGPNAGGKTVAMKSLALAALFVRAGLHVAAGPGARADLCDQVLADIGDEQDISESLSTFSAHMANVGRIVESATEHTLVVLDELGVGTDPSEGAAIAQAVLESLADRGARVVATTHYHLLKEMADVDPRFSNASVEFDEETLAPTYRLRTGIPGSSSATSVAARMGLDHSVIDRANAFLEREDRRLDRMLSELASSRAALEREKREAARLREETEASRTEYRHKLERLTERRDKLFREMRADLDNSFREAREEIAGVIRELQRGGTAQSAARAREKIERIEEKTSQAEERFAPAEQEALEPVDWRFARPGDAVRIRGGGSGVLRALPDNRGRVAVGIGSARVMVPVERVGQGEAPSSERAAPRVSVTGSNPGAEIREQGEPPSASDSGRCDLRGMRAEDALDTLAAALDRAVSADRHALEIVHGVGKGVLRRAVREHLSASAYVTRVEDAAPEQGGDGVTIAVLE